MASSLNDHGLQTTERVASCFSLFGTMFILFTFIYSPAFRKPVNRLIFYASWGNTLCNIATLMSQAPIRAGVDSHLCQFQGFLIQMFLPADALWNLAMAINVYLTIFHNYKPERLKSLEWKYHVMCYGGPFIVAFAYIFISTPSRGKIYGDATLWCWIDTNWVVLRIALVYAPAWLCILASFSIYVLAGRRIFSRRQQLRAFNAPPGHFAPIENPFTDFKTTEIHITRELASMQSPDPDMAKVYFSSEDQNPPRSQTPSNNQSYSPYTATIISMPTNPGSEAIGSPNMPRATVQQRKNRAALQANTAAWGYTKVAFLFFVSLLVTWIPSSLNRVYSLIHPDLVYLPYVYASGVVLPLMGFWNSVIYVVSSWSAVCDLLAGNLHHGQASVRHSRGSSRLGTGGRRKTDVDGDSVKGLAGGGYDQV